jgi:hypothetical protein
MNLLYVPSDQKYLDKRGMRTLFWLDDLGAIPLPEHPETEEGFLFSYARHINDYRQLVESLPHVRDRPEEREPVLALDKTLDRLASADVEVPMPKTWRIGVDERLPKDLTFPLFVRTVESSWKVGGEVSRVRTEKQYHEEAEQLRRAFGWNVPIMAREWLNLATAGESVYGRVPQEIRTWSVDGKAVAWSFHHLHAVPHPKGFPPARDDVEHLGRLASKVASAFSSRLIVADFVRLTSGKWVFLEAGPGSAAGTGHEGVFKTVASALCGKQYPIQDDAVGGVVYQ